MNPNINNGVNDEDFIELTQDQESKKESIIMKTDEGAKNGQTKCPKCGATDISLNPNTGLLRCNYCRHEFSPVVANYMNEDIHNLNKEVIASGATNIIKDTNDVVTLKCTSCGAEVVIDTKEAPHSRCHWCRNDLSINEQIPNGAIPDMVLPFKIKKDEARLEIEKFVNKRKFFANKKFKAEFTTENIMGVYLPYMVVDLNTHANLKGQGEIQIRKYTRGSGDSQKTYYDADVYDIVRDFDLLIDDLTIESSRDKLDVKASNKTTNIINAIMPFDTENCVKWDANYLKGFSSEKRDVNIDNLRESVFIQAKDIARYKSNEELTQYNRGVCFKEENLEIRGQRWSSTYLPIWLYSYQQVNGNKKLLHYVAVNARTKETMGSVPIDMPKLLGISTLIEIFSVLFWWVVLIDWDYGWLIILSGFIFYFVLYSRYRNISARHTHEKETKSVMENVSKIDNFVVRRTGLSSSKIAGANNHFVSNQTTNSKFLDILSDNSEIKDVLKSSIDNNLKK